MGWESRHGRRAYYYRTCRIHGKPRRVYLGTGAVGRMHAALDDDERVKKSAAADRRRAWAAADAALAAAVRFARAVGVARLVAAGWYDHRGEWRPARRRPRTRQDRPVPDVPFGPLDARLRVLSARASSGDGAARFVLVETLADGRELAGTAAGLEDELHAALAGLGVGLDGLTTADDPAGGLADLAYATADRLIVLAREPNPPDEAAVAAVRGGRAVGRRAAASRCVRLQEIVEGIDRGPLAESFDA